MRTRGDPRPRRLACLAIPIGTGWLLGACMEARGKQDLWIRQKPEVLEVLREQAIIQSAESSNRIEGVTVAANRLRPLVIGRARPRDRSEEELAGYRAALDWIFSRKNRVASLPMSFVACTLLPRADLRETPANGRNATTRSSKSCRVGSAAFASFQSPPRRRPRPWRCCAAGITLADDEERVPPLLIVATFVLDLLCIHPFRDGNGRVSRLTTSLLLQSQGFQVARYISLERLIEERGGRIRTFDLLVPNQALYQAEPRPELSSLVCCTPAHKHVPSNS